MYYISMMKFKIKEEKGSLIKVSSSTCECVPQANVWMPIKAQLLLAWLWNGLEEASQHQTKKKATLI